MWFSLGFGVACAIGAYCYTPWLWIFSVAALLFAVGALFVRRDWKLWRPVVASSLGVAMGLGWFCGYQHFYLQSAFELDGTQVALTAETSDYSYATNHGSAVKARLTLSGKSYPAVLYLPDKEQLNPGDRITGEFRLRMTHEGLEGNTYHRGNGVFLLGYATGECAFAPCDDTPFRYYPAVIRSETINRLETLFPEDVAFFTKALLIGDRSDVDYETNTAFKTSGISHIIAVSGLHVSILFSVIFILSGKKRVLTALLGIPLLLLFAAVAGFTPSITRACIMQIIMILALLINREYDPSTALSAAVLIMLLVNPVVITSASFQLSVGCMGGIFLFSGKIQNWIVSFRLWREWKARSIGAKLRQWFASGIAVTISAMFFTTPLVAYYFGCVSLVGMITNLLTLWAVSWIFYGILLACIVSFIWQQAAMVIAWLIAWLIRYVLAVARLLSGVPLSAVYTKSIYIVLWLALCYLLIAIFLLWKKRRPYILISCGLLGLVLALFCSWLEPMLDSSRMTVLNVGQGQCILLQAQGKNYLVDCGGDSDTAAADLAAETLMSMGIFELDGVILTHYDDDHAAGVTELLSRVPAQTVFLPRQTENFEMRQEILLACAGSSVYVEEDITLSWEDTSLCVFAPISDVSENERGLCVLFRGEKCDILITGDIGIDSEDRLVLQKDIPELTALVAGHHGSKYSTGAPLLAATSPQYVFISVGVDNSYGHPSQEVLDRLAEYGCQVYRTDQDGTIVFRR